MGRAPTESVLENRRLFRFPHFTILMKQDFQEAHRCQVPRRAVNDRKASAIRAQMFSQADAGRS